MRYGRGACPDGFLPVFSVDTEDEAEQLLVASCPRNGSMQFIAPELAQEQTLDNLYAFGDRLRERYELIKGATSRV